MLKSILEYVKERRGCCQAWSEDITYSVIRKGTRVRVSISANLANKLGFSEFCRIEPFYDSETNLMCLRLSKDKA